MFRRFNVAIARYKPGKLQIYFEKGEKTMIYNPIIGKSINALHLMDKK